MTSDNTPTDQLRSLLAPVRYVLWDLDGPVCRLFAGKPAAGIARDLVEQIDSYGMGGLLTEAERSATDPHVPLLAVHRKRGGDLVAELEAWLTRRELQAVPRAMPTPYADPLIRRWPTLGVRFAITTNNSARAASAYIESRGLGAYFTCIHGREQNLDLMKPNPHTLLQALKSLGAEPSLTLMLGDAPTDYEAALDAGVAFAGYARNAAKRQLLVEAGVKDDHIVNELSLVRSALPTVA
ncbi:HAD family hydrolase [Streptomyces sp. NPDC098781]|uniref:HAD family hydrolase n=1 Tax=Streptomyces sp. NPDC098781 TaxID=3366097 RepID=UPI00381FA69E